MAVIYMRHAVHGAKVAISEHEANYDEMHGWERYDPNDLEGASDQNRMKVSRRRSRASEDD